MRSLSTPQSWCHLQDRPQNRSLDPAVALRHRRQLQRWIFDLTDVKRPSNGSIAVSACGAHIVNDLVLIRRQEVYVFVPILNGKSCIQDTRRFSMFHSPLIYFAKADFESIARALCAMSSGC